MPVFAPGAWAGVNDSFLIARQKEQEQSLLAARRQQMEHQRFEMDNARADRAMKLRADRDAGNALYGLVQPTPPMPGANSAPPQGQPPGMGGPQMAPGIPQFSAPQGPQARPPMPQGPAPIPPYRTVPQGGAQQPQQPGANPNMAPPVVGGAGAQRPGDSMLMSILRNAKAQGIPPENLTSMVEAMNPALKMQLQEELAGVRADVAANNMQIRAILAGVAVKRADEQATHHRATEPIAQQNADANTARAGAAVTRAAHAGQGGAVKGWKEFRDANGVIYRDNVNAGLTQKKVDGKWVDVEAGLPEDAKPANSAASGAVAVRQNIVKAGVKNSLDRLAEIEKKYGDKANTSVMFGQHPSGPVTGAAYAAGRGMQSVQQQQIDAAWSSMIDEAIPVFTGGLRGSDSFRQFLMQQAPQPGDKPATVREKMRLLRQNIDGTSKAFFNKFKSDPSMWAPGEKPDADNAPAAASGEDAKAIEWAKANPKDPRAAQILKKNGM